MKPCDMFFDRMRFHRLFFSSIAAVLMGLAAVLTGAAPGAAGESVRMLDEVVVTAGRVEEVFKEISADITIIHRAEIQQSSAANVADLLAEKGIGHIQKYPGTLTAIGIRGFRTDSHGNDLQGKVLVLLDGRRSGTGNVAKILTRNLERIEIIRGPGAVQYGSAGMGGVVNIITRKGTDNGLHVSAGAGSFDRVQGTVGGTVNQNGFDFAGAVSRETRGDYETGGGQTYENTGIDTETGISANLGYTFGDRHRIGLIFTGFEAEESGDSGYIMANDLDNYSDKKSHSIDLGYTGGSKDTRFEWMMRYFTGRDKNTWIDPVASNPGSWDDGIPTQRETDLQGAQAQVTGFWGDTRLTAGGDWVDYDIESDFTPNQSTYENTALFLLARTGFFNDRLVTHLGLRHDWYDVAVTEPAGRSEDTTRFTPSIGIAWMALPDLKLRAQYAQGFMLPTADQLSADPSTGWMGNPDLDPEKSATWEAGLDWFKNGLQASLTWFHTDFEDKIVSDFLANGTSTWKNEGDAEISGFQADISYDVGMPLGWSWEVRPYVGFTALTNIDDKTTGQDLLYVSKRHYLAGLLVDSGQGTFVRFNAVHTGSQDIEDWQSVIWPAPVPVVKKKSFWVANLTGAWRFYESEQAGRFSIRGEVHNLFDEDYAYAKGYPMPGRSFFAGIEWDF
ncbi:MAG: TonB-dependent receptor plug domain-containing protein [Desulfotignum sp.]